MGVPGGGLLPSRPIVSILSPWIHAVSHVVCMLCPAVAYETDDGFWSLSPSDEVNCATFNMSGSSTFKGKVRPVYQAANTFQFIKFRRVLSYTMYLLQWSVYKGVCCFEFSVSTQLVRWVGHVGRTATWIMEKRKWIEIVYLTLYWKYCMIDLLYKNVVTCMHQS